MITPPAGARAICDLSWQAGVSELERVLAAAKDEEMNLAIVDAAPHAAPDATRIARAASLVAIPCRPAAFDLAAMDGAVRIIQAAEAKGVIILSACPFRAPEIVEAREAEQTAKNQ